MLTKSDLDTARSIVYAAMPATPQYCWPLLCERLGAEVWVKHENHTPIGAFKIRGGLVHMQRRRERGDTGGVISATRGNHGQSIATAGRLNGIPVTIVVPLGNSLEKNAAMRAQGAELIEAGKDFDEAAGIARQMADDRGLSMIPSFHEDLVHGVATYAAELFDKTGTLDRVYVPIGLGSGICGMIGVRDLMGLTTEIVGVVSTGAPAYLHSFKAQAVVATNEANTFADGVAVRTPNADALAIICKGAADVIAVDDGRIADALRILYQGTHNLAEGAGAVALAGALAEKDRNAGKRVGVVLSGGNIDLELFARVAGLAAATATDLS